MIFADQTKTLIAIFKAFLDTNALELKTLDFWMTYASNIDRKNFVTFLYNTHAYLASLDWCIINGKEWLHIKIPTDEPFFITQLGNGWHTYNFAHIQVHKSWFLLTSDYVGYKELFRPMFKTFADQGYHRCQVWCNIADLKIKFMFFHPQRHTPNIMIVYKKGCAEDDYDNREGFDI